MLKLFMLISVQQLDDDEVHLFHLAPSTLEGSIEVLRKVEFCQCKLCLGLVVKEIVDLHNWSTMLIF